MLGLKGEYWGGKGDFSPIFCFHPNNPSTSPQRKKFSFHLAQPVAHPCPPQANPSFSEGPSPLSPNQPPQGTPPLRTGPSLVAVGPLTLPFPHVGDAGNAHFWVSSANTPLPKHPSCPVRHTLSPQPPLPPSSPPPHNGPLSSGHSTPACPLGHWPKTAAGSESSKEELLSQPLSWPILPSWLLPGPLPLSQASGGISTEVKGAWPLRPGRRGWENSRPQTLRAVSTRLPGTRWNCQLGPRGARHQAWEQRLSPTSLRGWGSAPGPSVPGTGA